MYYFIRAEQNCEYNSVSSLHQGDEDDVDIIFEEGRKVSKFIDVFRISISEVWIWIRRIWGVRILTHPFCWARFRGKKGWTKMNLNTFFLITAHNSYLIVHFIKIPTCLKILFSKVLMIFVVETESEEESEVNPLVEVNVELTEENRHSGDDSNQETSRGAAKEITKIGKLFCYLYFILLFSLRPCMYLNIKS